MKKEKRSNAVFYGLMGIMLGLFVISLIATGGKSIYQFLFYDRKDIFMDFSTVSMIVSVGILMERNVSIRR